MPPLIAEALCEGDDNPRKILSFEAANIKNFFICKALTPNKNSIRKKQKIYRVCQFTSFLSKYMLMIKCKEAKGRHS